MYRCQLASHGMGAGACLAISGIDMALWDITRQGAEGCRSTGCSAEAARQYLPMPAASRSATSRRRARRGGEEERSTRATRRSSCASAIPPKNDIERMSAVRKAFGDELVILTDANIGYQLEDVRRVMPALDELARRLAGGALPGARLPQLPRGEAARPHAARRRREPLHALRVQPRDRGRRHHHPAARSVEDAAASPRRCASPPWPRPGSCRSTRTAR